MLCLYEVFCLGIGNYLLHSRALGMLMRKVTNMIVINTPVPNLMVASSISCFPMAIYPRANIRTTVAIIASAVLAKTEIFNIVLTLLFHVVLVLSYCVEFINFSIRLSNKFDISEGRLKIFLFFMGVIWGGIEVENFDEILKKESERLLFIEKDRRGVDRDELVFMGMANVASYWWCGMKALLLSREMEIDFFLSYLEDRISYSFRLGLIDELLENVEKWLDIGDNIKFDDIEKLLAEEESIWFEIPGISLSPDGREVIFVVNPKCSREMVDAAIAELKRKYGDENVFITDIEKEPKRLGLIWRLNPRDRG